MKAQRRRGPKIFVGQYEQTLRKWAPSVGLDPDLAVWIEGVLNPLNFPWRDLQNMKARVFDYWQNMGKQAQTKPQKTQQHEEDPEDHLSVDRPFED